MKYDIQITKTTAPKARPTDESKLGFGKIFTDHMFLMDYNKEQGWHNGYEGVQSGRRLYPPLPPYGKHQAFERQRRAPLFASAGRRGRFGYLKDDS